MTVELRPETEQLVLKELESGQFHSVEKVISQPASKQTLGQFLLESPLRDSGLSIERKQDYPVPTEL